MYPILFSVGNITIYSFGLLLSIAILVCGVGLSVLAKKSNLDTKNLFDKYLLAIFFSIICARLAYFILYPDAFRAPAGSFWAIFALWQGGLVFYGALIGGFLAFLFIFRKNRSSLLKWLDIIYLMFIFGLSIGQLGCTLGGCSLGATTEVALSINHKIPASLYESIFALILFIVSIIYYINYHLKTTYRNGTVFVLGMGVFLGGRMMIDYFKVSKIVLWGVTAYLWVDIIIVVVITLMLFSLAMLKLKAKRKKDNSIP